MNYRMLFAGLFLAALALAQPPDTVWTRTYDVAGSEDDALALAADAYGNVFFFGLTMDTSYRSRFVIIKYGADGTVLSTRYTPYEFAGDYDGGITVDHDGDVVVAYPSHDDYLVAKYAPDADTLWTRRFDTGDDDYPYDVACDRSGNYIVTGRSHNGNGDWDYLTVKYSPAGDTVWSRRWDSGNSDWATSVAVDSTNSIVVCGGCDGSCYLKYDSLGNLLWAHPQTVGGVVGVAVEPHGCVLLAGADTNYLPTLTRTNPEGDTLWAAQIAGEAGAATVVCPDAGSILVTGIVNESMCLARYDTLGGQAWRLYWRDSLEVTYSALCLDTAGNAVVAVTSGGYSFVNSVTVIKYATAQGIAERSGAEAGPAPLLQQHNPCRGSATIHCRAVESSPLELSVYDATGRQVRVLSAPQSPVPNPYSLTWDGRDELGRIVPAGTYLLCWKAGAKQGSTAVVLLR